MVHKAETSKSEVPFVKRKQRGRKRRKEKEMKRRKLGPLLKADDAIMCEKCGEMIIGEYEYIRTRRKTDIYLHKRMQCPSEKEREKERK